MVCVYIYFDYFFQADDGIRDLYVTGVQTCALPISTMVVGVVISTAYASGAVLTAVWGYLRSEERRVGKECRFRGPQALFYKNDSRKSDKRRKLLDVNVDCLRLDQLKEIEGIESDCL